MTASHGLSPTSRPTGNTVAIAMKTDVYVSARRMCDRIIAAVSLIVLSPALIGGLVAVLIRMGRPVHFRQNLLHIERDRPGQSDSQLSFRQTLAKQPAESNRRGPRPGTTIPRHTRTWETRWLT